MSTVLIGMATQPKDFGPITYGSLNLTLTISGQAYPLNLTLSPVSGYLRFQEVVWFSPQAASDGQQRQNYVTAFNRDFRSVGGTNNLRAQVTVDGILVEAQVGTFSAGTYTGNLLTGITFAYDNSVQVPPVTFNIAKTGLGDCTVEGYRAQTATGGTAPYRVVANGVELFTGWDGASDRFFDLLRTSTYKILLYDSTGTLLRVETITPARNLAATDFEVQVTPYIGYADLSILRTVLRTGTDPLEYNLVDESLQETGWQTSALFGGITPGLYTVRIRDRYDCEVAKQVNVADIQTSLQANRPDYFSVSEFNSLSFFKERLPGSNERKNYTNTPGWQENVGLPKSGALCFPDGPTLGTQFRSSYPVHQVSLHRFGQVPRALPFFLIQENMGLTERVDCKLFRIPYDITDIIGSGSIVNGVLVPSSAPNGMGVYFDGGDRYEPNTTNRVEDSPYTFGLPPWAQVGNFVSLVGVGTFAIVETDLYDEDRGVFYFKLDYQGDEGDAIVQTTWDRHPYNVYKILLDRSEFGTEGAFIRIQPGAEVDGTLVTDINNVHRSERFFKVTDTSKLVNITWSSFRNIGEMLFTDGTVGEMWIKGRVRPVSSTSSEFEDSDQGAISVDQEAQLRMRAFFPLMTARQWRKLDLVGTIGNRGRITVDGMEVVRIGSSEQEELGDTNLSNVTVDFAFSGESTAISQEDPVFSTDTGTVIVPDGGPLTGKEQSDAWMVEGNRLVDDEGNFVKVLDNGQEKYIEIN